MKIFIYGLSLQAKERVIDNLGKRAFDNCQIDPETLLFNVTLNENVIVNASPLCVILDLAGRLEIINSDELEIVKIK